MTSPSTIIANLQDEVSNLYSQRLILARDGERLQAALSSTIEQRDELLAALEDVKIYLQDTQAQRHIYDRVIKAIASAKGGAA